MPNWCANVLTIRGPLRTVQAFRKKAVGYSPWHKPEEQEQNALNFHSLVPIPKKILKKGYDRTGYNWENKHWGMKWGACNTQLVDDGGERLVYDFETAWGPPLAFLKNAGRLWPKLTFVLDYEEEGMCFKGIAKAEGRKFEDHCIDY